MNTDPSTSTSGEAIAAVRSALDLLISDHEALERQLAAANQEWAVLPCYQIIAWQDRYQRGDRDPRPEPCGSCHVCIRQSAIRQTLEQHGSGLVAWMLAAEDLADAVQEEQDRSAMVPSHVRVTLEDYRKAATQYEEAWAK